eukprot:CAMPEP_0194290130 /NCGR_PEP_ID=MMETSP0169-20130528/40617_1 /TAXON_ID=218684 /ORGANISM="Corethron pennatum, Strain L29A3" /LENGTH=171 /DNA_ID=CAMNT_0039037639 /DNA_START=45 /DNA_END=560 /DNA_ORIENTATION=+
MSVLEAALQANVFFPSGAGAAEGPPLGINVPKILRPHLRNVEVVIWEVIEIDQKKYGGTSIPLLPFLQRRIRRNDGRIISVLLNVDERAAELLEREMKRVRLGDWERAQCPERRNTASRDRENDNRTQSMSVEKPDDYDCTAIGIYGGCIGGILPSRDVMKYEESLYFFRR